MHRITTHNAAPPPKVASHTKCTRYLPNQISTTHMLEFQQREGVPPTQRQNRSFFSQHHTRLLLQAAAASLEGWRNNCTQHNPSPCPAWAPMPGWPDRRHRLPSLTSSQSREAGQPPAILNRALPLTGTGIARQGRGGGELRLPPFFFSLDALLCAPDEGMHFVPCANNQKHAPV